MTDFSNTVYRLCGRDQIVYVNEHWDRFASANEAPDALASERILGRSLWDFITDDVTRQWLAAILSLARVANDVVERKYRCDSPDLKRLMLMRVVRQPGAELLLEHFVIRQERIDPPIKYQYAGIGHTTYCTQCSVCRRIRDGCEWIEPETAGRSLRAAQGLVGAAEPTVIEVVYSVCEDCMAQIA